MRVDDFVYHRPDSIAQAVALLRELGPGVHFVAGGTDLLPDLKRGRETARHLVALGGLADLRGIRREEDGCLRIGALCTLAEVATSPLVREFFPALAEATGMLGAVQIRNQGTLGGNFCRAVPCADTPPICVAAGAEVLLSDGGNERRVPATEFFVGPRKTCRRPDEVMLALAIPPQPPGAGACYQRFTLRGGLALAVASVAARVVLAGGRVESRRRGARGGGAGSPDRSRLFRGAGGPGPRRGVARAGRPGGRRGG
ncbi:MAG: FAD binding domain-containing protein [Acidobacteriota bacterium]|nr:FAD binding domain-containing protein [Acidobacteriota bacterium]